jgi:cob(I)alamin adenosyltransferase
MQRIHIYVGDGKGKTTAALGLLLRFLGSGGKAVLIQCDKGAGTEEFYSERVMLRMFPGLAFHPTGKVRFSPKTGTFRFRNIPEDRVEALRALELAKSYFGNRTVGLLVLDEILSTLATELLKPEEILGFLDAYEQAGRPWELVFTGHALCPGLAEKADLITHMQKVKHYFDAGESARKGIEF